MYVLNINHSRGKSIGMNAEPTVLNVDPNRKKSVSNVRLHEPLIGEKDQMTGKYDAITVGYSGVESQRNKYCDLL